MTETSSRLLRLVVVDDQDVVRAGFAALLDTQGDFTVVGTAADGAAAIRVCRDTNPDIVLMDVRMPVMDGIEATREIISRSASDGKLRIIMLTTFDLDEHVYDALNAGASGFLLKDMPAERLFDAVRIIATGEALLAPTVTRRLIGEFVRLRPQQAKDESRFATLTPREIDVLCLIADGSSNSEIAKQFSVSGETVKTHVGRIFAKLGVRDRAQAVVAAYESGLVVPGSGR
jgi:DNA-binding NarL/FixJ family response regulator